MCIYIDHRRIGQGQKTTTSGTERPQSTLLRLRLFSRRRKSSSPVLRRVGSIGRWDTPLQYISVLSSKYPGRLSAHWPLQLIQHLIHPWPTPAVSSCGAGRSRSRTPPTQYVKGNSLGLLHPIAAGGPGLGHDLRRPGFGRHQLLNTGTAAHGWADWSVSLVLYLLCSSWPKRVLELLGLGLSRTF